MDDTEVIRTYGNKSLPEGTPERPLVTFAVFAYNQEKYIREAVEGAFAQTYSPLEIILSDDCSTDRTFEIMEEMARKYKGPHRVVVRREPKNCGVLAHVINVAKLSNGEFLVVAAGDDISLPDRTEVTISVMLAQSLDTAVVSGDDIMFDNYGGEYDNRANSARRFRYYQEQKAWFHGATACFRVDVIRKLPAPTSKVLFEDMALMHTFAAIGFRSSFIDSPLIYRRAHDNNVGPIRLTGYDDVWSRERRQLEMLAHSADALDYAAAAAESLGHKGCHLRERADFVRRYIKWADMPLPNRLQLLSSAVRNGYGRSLLLRLLGKKVFILSKMAQRSVANMIGSARLS